MIHGPPGTGKTTTLTELIAQLLHKNRKIIVCAQSNTAVDNLMQKCILNIKNKVFLRIGNGTKIDAKIVD